MGLREDKEDAELVPEEDKVPSRADVDLAESLVCPAAVERADAVPARVEEALDEVPLPLAEALVSLSFARRAVVPVPLTEGRTLRSAAALARRAVEPAAREDVVPARVEARLVFASALAEAWSPGSRGRRSSSAAPRSTRNRRSSSRCPCGCRSGSCRLSY